MNILEAIILGIIQGLTEFLPVSSSGHLELGKAILGSVPEEGMLMTVVLHFATALSTIVIFRKDIAEIFLGLFKFKNNKELRFSIMIVLSMIPAALVGVFLEDEIDAFFSGNILLVGAMLILTGGLLFLADKAKGTDGKVSPMKAVIIGIAQAIAILPGISRSGATIGTSVLLGVDKSRAARFSFLMVVPLIFGAMAVKTKNYLDVKGMQDGMPVERSKAIVNELKEDHSFLSKDPVAIEIAFGAREVALDRMNKDVVPSKTSVNEIDSIFGYNLIEAGLTQNELDLIMKEDLMAMHKQGKTSMTILLTGFLAAFITGLFACTWMIKIVKRSKLKYFSFYCFAVGALAIVWSLI